ncbi:glycoside hydrolase family 19 protein [Azospirillum tabaci]|uniref:glycoside hydrolase family 19 protein n=1 Tax=Azospirillum tabaci TaxID=2752310 RepID=UPI001FE41518|nr:glycoside hydrolase family 19 protein [Azospirillum tabaci]
MSNVPSGAAVTLDLLQRLFPTGRELPAFAASMAARLPPAAINTPQRVAAFLSQVGHESGGLRVWTENLNYSAEGLRKTWPQRFRDAATATAYARQPERIANRVYGDRMGNGPEASGDGWRYRGRGLIQITGRDNYQRCSGWAGKPLEAMPAWLETPDGAVASAVWFWTVNGLNRLADAGELEAITRRINGGLNGQEDRLSRYALASEALGISPVAVA